LINWLSWTKNEGNQKIKIKNDQNVTCELIGNYNSFKQLELSYNQFISYKFNETKIINNQQN